MEELWQVVDPKTPIVDMYVRDIPGKMGFGAGWVIGFRETLYG